MIEIVLPLFILLILFMWYMGLFSKLEITQDKFKGGFYFYYNYQGHINSAALFQKTLQKEI